jgi:hypothetical protein
MLFPKQVPCCKRNFHEDCLNKWYAKSPTCPNCRASKNRIPNADLPYYHALQSFYNFYNREFANSIIPKYVGADREIDEICRKYANMIRVEFMLRHQSRMINELARLYKSRQAQRFIAEIQPVIDEPPKKRGRPVGSKNKPKNPLANEVKKVSRQEKEKKERENRILNMLKEYNIIDKRQEQQEELNQAIAKKKEEERIANEELAKKKEELAKKKEDERIAKEAIENAERIKKEAESNPIKMAGNAALKRAIISILDKGGYGK